MSIYILGVSFLLFCVVFCYYLGMLVLSKCKYRFGLCYVVVLIKIVVDRCWVLGWLLILIRRSFIVESGYNRLEIGM